ncbi:GNAT family protein [Cytophagaceae bacterium DM2B3-1]|uniref:GNAT family protein n=1 Tax=Xanthocytophaga flava TaxID=3048013 RepID=A0ABT7CI03_9BACT|nr:GNAT family protein [Xanthocytophaga flavus]MDJ1493367.1 GNAT family protein [Xanthocytophaga flavus]
MSQIQLEPFTSVDFDQFIGWITSEKALIQFAGPTFHYPLTREQLEMHISSESREIFRVRHSTQNCIIGHAEMVVNKRNESARLALILIGDPNMRGKGLGKELIRELLSLGFNKMNLHRLELNVYDFNQSAIACYQQAGFRIEGILRENQRVGNQFWSTIVMSILKNEWESQL